MEACSCVLVEVEGRGRGGDVLAGNTVILNHPIVTQQL